MEEREALKRQIELLQNLINKHKRVHGDTPFERVEQRHLEAPAAARGRGHSTSVIHPHSSRGRPYAPQTRGSWRKTYSLNNKNPQSSFGHHSASASSSVDQSSSKPVSHSVSLPGHSRGEEGDRTTAATLSSGIAQQKKDGHVSSVTGIKEDATKKTSTYSLCKRVEGAVVSQHQGGKGDASATGTSMQHEMRSRQTQDFQLRAKSSHVVLPGKVVSASSEVPSSVKTNTLTSLQSSSEVLIKPSLTSKTSSETKQTPTVPMTGNTTLPLSALSKVTKQPSLDITFQTSQAHVGGSFLKKSKFTWVKSQNVGGVEPRQGSSISIPTGKAVTVTPTSVLKAEVASGSSPSFTVSKRTPAKKLPRKLSPVTVAPKTSKYKWVSSSAGAQAKTSRKPLSPKALTLAQRALDKREATKKLRAPSTPSAKIKKATCSSLSSRYRWKAGGQGASGAATAVARRRSAFHWTSEKSSKGVKGGLLVSPPQRASVSSSSPGVFKLRSRMKIIRKSANSGGGSERGSSPSAVKYSPRGRIYTSTRTPIGVRRTPTRELVSFGRHKLRRLSPTLSRTSPASSSHCSPVSQRVFRTRYKIVTRLGSSATHTPQYNPALSWRAKRIQSARSFLQSRLRAPHDRHPSSTQHWRGSGMCWIGGSLYRVSANKLSRTALSNTPISRTGRSFSPHVSYMIPAWNRPSSTRHLASRAVQRSLAIIRHARQKKQQKQYCMYYNRFGKCNRGNSCPYIHDPDKVAVCTRFLRGTCKQADGTCPFSHKVAKEKMPVCSYFLKGICNNSDCPYSHVYVSRKAEVCEDFVKGYCPEGEKCKKKHTLVCPDFSKTGSCPRGTRCKLQHRQRPKRSTSNTSTTPAKRARTKEPSKSPRPRLSVIMPHGPQAAPGMPTAGPLELPSYISLSSSPEEADAPDTLQAETSQVKEKKLQIKPRL